MSGCLSQSAYYGCMTFINSKTTLFLNLCAALTLAVGFWGCSASEARPPLMPPPDQGTLSAAQAPYVSKGEYAQAIFAGGCFWCVESDFEKLDGVVEAISGYSGGHLDQPTYKDVTSETSGHYEVAKIVFDSTQVSYEQILEHFWTHVDPTDDGGQFCDRGESYRTAIFATPKQVETARASKAKLQDSGRLKNPVVTPILPAVTFYPAEDYHQDYYKKNSLRYNFYRSSCGRDKRIAQVWSK